MHTRTILATLTAAAALLLTGCGAGAVNTGQVGPAQAGAPSSSVAADQKQTPTWGQRYTWPSGLAVEVTKPATCKPGQYASPPNVTRAVKVTITVVNGTDKAINTALLSTVNAQFAGANAETVFDSGGKCGDGGMNAADVLPGKTFTFDIAFSVGKDPGELQLSLQPDIMGDKAVFLGQA